MVDLMQASNQWASRPDDERFPDLDSLLAFVRGVKDRSAEAAPVPRNLLAVSEDDRSKALVLTAGASPPMALSNWSFSQVCGLAKPAAAERALPSSALGHYPAGMVAPLLTYGLTHCRDPRKRVKLLAERPASSGGLPRLRAVTGESYGRIWDAWCVEAVCGRAAESGWVVPPAYGDRPAGLYASDRDLFCFMVDSPEASYMVRDPESDRTEALHRGFFLWNSEVGSKSVGLLLFWFNGTCGNHIVWAASQIKEIRLKHTAHVRTRIGGAVRRGLQLAAGARSDDLDGIRAAMSSWLVDKSAKVEKVVPVVQRRTGLSQRISKRAVDLAVAEGSNPRTAWGAVQGVTALARGTAYADARVELERAAAGLMPKPRGRDARVVVDV